MFQKREDALPGHNGEGIIEQLAAREPDRREPAIGGDVGLLLDGGEEFVAETDRAFGPGVNEIGGFDDVNPPVTRSGTGRFQAEKQEPDTPRAKSTTSMA